jgi:hypothetical protein
MPVLRQEGRSGFTPPGFEYRVLPGAEKQRLILCTNWLVGLAEEDRAIWNASYAYMHRTRFFCSPFASAAVSYTAACLTAACPRALTGAGFWPSCRPRAHNKRPIESMLDL